MKWGPVRGAAAIALLAALVASGPAAARGIANPVGYDISYPQCNSAFPTGGAFGIVGVNKGLPFSANPCLGSGDGPSELMWAGMNAQLYANTADPGPALSSHWPNGQTAPQQCNTAASPGADTTTCAYDYGWNAAADSYLDAVNAYVSLSLAAAGATRTPVANAWWLDVETVNSWEANPANNVAELQGEADYLKSVGAASVGFYSPAANWQTITGGTTAFASYPSWVPGASSLSDAQARCSAVGFTGGPVLLVQFPNGASVADLACAVQPSLSFQTASFTVVAGKPSPPITLMLSSPASAPVSVSLGSSSGAGRFSSAAAGPWTATLTLSLAANATQAPAVYYEDTVPGSPVLTATAAGYTSATQTETVTVAPTPSCKLARTADRNFELALAHTRTRAAAARILHEIARQAHAQHHGATVEQDGCTDFEVAVLGFRSRAAVVLGAQQARRRFRQAAVEKT